jgi:hypothetical protein
MVLCDDGTKLVWKSNITDILASHATFKYTCKNHLFTLQSLNSDGSYDFVKKDVDAVLSYDSSYTSSSRLTLATDNNVRKSIIYGGINYSISYGDGDKIVKMAFKTPTTQITPVPYNTNLASGVKGLFYNNSSGEIEVDITTLDLKIFFIPHIDHSHDAKGLIQFSTDYTTSVHFFVDYINGVLPSNYKPLVENTVADENSIVIFTQTHDQKIKYIYSYCVAGDSCGKCMGVCSKDEVCSVHLQSKTSDIPMVCNHTPYQTSKYEYIMVGIFGALFLIIAIIVYMHHTTEKKKDRTERSLSEIYNEERKEKINRDFLN